MTKEIRIGALLIAMLPFVAVCDGDDMSDEAADSSSGSVSDNKVSCDRFCAEIKQCPDGPYAADSNCGCDELDELTVKAGCVSPWRVALDCTLGKDDICSDLPKNTICAGENTAVVDCTRPYCDANPDDADCVAVGLGS